MTAIWTPEMRARHSERMRNSPAAKAQLARLNADPEHRAQLARLNADPRREEWSSLGGQRTVASGQIARLNADPAHQAAAGRIGGQRAVASGQIARVTALARSGLKPTAPERIVAAALQSPWRYAGDNTFRIRTAERTRFPDFVNEETREVVEVFGDYWHDPARSPHPERCDTPEQRIAEYAAVGWKCEVVWERDVQAWARARRVMA